MRQRGTGKAARCKNEKKGQPSTAPSFGLPQKEFEPEEAFEGGFYFWAHETNSLTMQGAAHSLA
jgi:hypothetical protein